MGRHTHSLYTVDGFRIDTSRLCVFGNGIEQHVRPKTFQVLVFLLENKERLVTRNELIDQFWSGTAVTDNTLDQCMGEIRRLLGDDPRTPRYLKTVPRQGYRFIGDVVETQTELTSDGLSSALKDGSSLPSRFASATSQITLLCIAVLMIVAAILAGAYAFKRGPAQRSLMSTTLQQDPSKEPVAVMFFSNETGDQQLDWLREGLADMMITDLSRVTSLTVLSRDQLRALLERQGHSPAQQITLEEAINSSTGAQAKVFVMGSIAKLGEQMRIDVHLHDARDGQLLTAERLVIDRPDQILTQIDLLSSKIASYLGAKGELEPDGLSSAMTGDLEAYRYYSLGIEKGQALQASEAIDLLKKAVARDPQFAMAWARIGYTYVVRSGEPEKGKPYLEKAFQLSDRLSAKDKLYITSWYAIASEDYPAAVTAFREIVVRYPLDMEAYDVLGGLLIGEEQPGAAIETLKQGLVIDPGAKNLYNKLGSAYLLLGQTDDAFAMLRRYVDLAPQEPNAHDSLASAFEWVGNYEQAIAEYNRALQIKPDFEIAVIHLGNTFFQMGRYRDAIQEFRRYLQVSPSDHERSRGLASIALVEKRMGDLRSATRDAERSFRMGAQEPLFLIELDKKPLPVADKFKALFETSLFPNRGARDTLRPVLYRRGLLDLRSGRTEAAIANFKEALTHRPVTWNLDSYEDCLANAYLEMGDLDDAIAEYRRIQAINPNYPLLDYHLGQAFQRKGMRDEARSSFTRFLEIWKDADPQIPEVIAVRSIVSVGSS